MSVAVVIPWRAGCPWRERALEWVSARWAEAHPGWPVIVSADSGCGAWSKAEAVARGVGQSEADVVVIADADAWAGPIGGTVDQVAAGTAPWGRPFNRVLRLDEEGTLRIILGGESPEAVGRETRHKLRRPYHHRAAGGLVVLRRSSALEIPIDPRFRGHGAEDFAWADALDTLLGPRLETDVVLFHLWHSPQGKGPLGNTLLATRYRLAFKRPDAMRRIIAEALAGPEQRDEVA